MTPEDENRLIEATLYCTMWVAVVVSLVLGFCWVADHILGPLSDSGTA